MGEGAFHIKPGEEIHIDSASIQREKDSRHYYYGVGRPPPTAEPDQAAQSPYNDLSLKYLAETAMIRITDKMSEGQRHWIEGAREAFVKKKGMSPEESLQNESSR